MLDGERHAGAIDDALSRLRVAASALVADAEQTKRGECVETSEHGDLDDGGLVAGGQLAAPLVAQRRGVAGR